MNVPNWKRLTKSDYPDMPEWFEGIADALNQQLDTLTLMAQGNIAAAENFFAEVRTLEMPQDTTVSIELQKLKRNPIGVLLLSSDFLEYGRVTWEMNGQKTRTVDVKVKWDSDPTETPMATLLFLGG